MLSPREEEGAMGEVLPTYPTVVSEALPAYLTKKTSMGEAFPAYPIKNMHITSAQKIIVI